MFHTTALAVCTPLLREGCFYAVLWGLMFGVVSALLSRFDFYGLYYSRTFVLRQLSLLLLSPRSDITQHLPNTHRRVLWSPKPQVLCRETFALIFSKLVQIALPIRPGDTSHYREIQRLLFCDILSLYTHHITRPQTRTPANSLAPTAEFFITEKYSRM